MYFKMCGALRRGEARAGLRMRAAAQDPENGGECP